MWLRVFVFKEGKVSLYISKTEDDVPMLSVEVIVNSHLGNIV